MSTIFFNLGTHSHNRAVPNGGYRSSKGVRPFNNPVGITPGSIRPIYNQDPLNDQVYRFGLPRPIKHYRAGYLQTYVDDVTRQVRTYTGSDHMVSTLMDGPGGYSIIDTPTSGSCIGNVVSDWQPSASMTDNPSSLTASKEYCCNLEKKAIVGVRPANTVLKKTYYTTNSAYLYNKCHTFDQHQFNYLIGGNIDSKPGGPLSLDNTYMSNCAGKCIAGMDMEGNVLSPTGCSKVLYKPNNYKFAKQGAVSSSERLLRLTVDTIKR